MTTLLNFTFVRVSSPLRWKGSIFPVTHKRNSCLENTSNAIVLGGITISFLHEISNLDLSTSVNKGLEVNSAKALIVSNEL